MVIYAVNSAEEKIAASDVAQRGIEPPYKCPTCNNDLFFVSGGKRARPHFMHRKGESCIEYNRNTATTPIKTFRQNMLSLFPPESQCVPLRVGSEEFVTVDVFCNGLVLFFVSNEEQIDRDDFRSRLISLTAAGFQICIIVDVQADIYLGSLVPMSPENDTKLKWDSPPSCIRWLDPKTQKAIISVYLYLDDGVASGSGYPEINRVVWAAPPGENAWSRIVIDRENLRVDESVSPDDIFLTVFERAWKYVEKRKVKKFAELYAGEKGKGSKTVYSCPMRGDWLNARSCIRCPHVVAAIYYSTKDGKCNRVFCGYPEIVNPAGRKCKTFGHY